MAKMVEAGERVEAGQRAIERVLREKLSAEEMEDATHRINLTMANMAAHAITIDRAGDPDIAPNHRRFMVRDEHTTEKTHEPNSVTGFVEDINHLELSQLLLSFAELDRCTVLPLLMARGGVLDAHLGDCHLGHVDQRGHSGFPRHGRHGYGRLEVPGGHGHAEVDPAAAADDAINITRFEEVADHHLGAGGS